MSKVTLRITPNRRHRSGSAEVHEAPAAISFNEPVRIRLEVPASAVEPVRDENGDLVYRFDVVLDMTGASGNPLDGEMTITDKTGTHADSDDQAGPSGP